MPPDLVPVNPGDELAELTDRVHRALVADTPIELPDRELIEQTVQSLSPLLPVRLVEQVAAHVLDRFGGLAPLSALFDDPEITEIMINAGAVWVERGSDLSRCDVHLDADAIARLIEDIVTPLDRRVDRASPLVDARLADGSRVNIVIPPLAADGPCVTIRRFRTRRIGLADFTAGGWAEALPQAVRQKANIVVSGGTGSGKTTMLNALGAFVGSGERIITIEDTVELDLGLDHVVRLEARPPNAEGAGAVDIRALLRNALRMRPDRILVGEVRGQEVLDMLQAMNTGHEGSLSTCHANAPRDALRRLETMCLLGADSIPVAVARDLVSASVDVVVQVGRVGGGGRRILSVVEIEGDDWMAPDALVQVGPTDSFRGRWIGRGGHHG